MEAILLLLILLVKLAAGIGGLWVARRTQGFWKNLFFIVLVLLVVGGVLTAVIKF